MSHLQSWDSNDILVLKDNRLLSSNDLSQILQRTPAAVELKRQRLNLPRLDFCSDCGKLFTPKNQQSRCPDCVPSKLEYQRARTDTPRGRFSMYKTNARKRHVDFNLTLEEFSSFWQEPCTYCGSEITTIGLDRIDNENGYIMENVTSCCETCNRMKLTLTELEWFSHMRRILNYSQYGEIK